MIPDGLLVFDGTCGFCSWFVRLVAWMDVRGAIRFTWVQSAYGRLLCARCGVDADDPSTLLFIDCGRALERTDAIIAMLGRLEPPWRWLRALGLVPRPLRDGVYRWTARNRYRLMGRQACAVPSEAMRARFVEDEPPDG